MQEAQYESSVEYQSFNDFFTRKLKVGARSIISDDNTIICPVDGSISQLGQIVDGQLIQAKGFNFTAQNLLGGEQSLAEKFQHGLFATLYLSPKDYHCIHMPYDGRLKKMLYIPGKLFSVNQLTAANVPNLFARNERVVCIFDTAFGEMAIVLVGAFFVASIHTTWAGKITPGIKRQITEVTYDQQPIFLKKGELLGHFELGSTVIILLPANVAQFDQQFVQQEVIKMGQAMLNLLLP